MNVISFHWHQNTLALVFLFRMFKIYLRCWLFEHLNESNELILILGVDILSLKLLEGSDWNVGDQCVELVG